MDKRQTLRPMYISSEELDKRSDLGEKFYNCLESHCVSYVEAETDEYTLFGVVFDENVIRDIVYNIHDIVLTDEQIFVWPFYQILDLLYKKEKNDDIH